MVKKEREFDEEDEEEAPEEDEEQESEPELDNIASEKYLVYHTQKGIMGTKQFYLEFVPDAEFLGKSYGNGLFTICDRQYNKEKKKIVWSKLTSVLVDSLEGTETPKKNPITPIFSGGANEGIEALRKTGVEIREVAISQLIMAFAKTMEKGDYTAAEKIGNVLTGNPEKREDGRYEKLVDKLIERTLTQQTDPVGSLKEQISTLKSLKGLMDSPAEKKDTWEMVAEMADKHLPSIMDAANKNAELQKEIIELRKKEVEARTAASSAQKIMGQQTLTPVMQKPPVLDRFLMKILKDADAGQLQGLIALNWSQEKLRPMVEESFNFPAMPDEEFNDMAELFEQKNVNIEIILKRLSELGTQNQHLKNISLILSTAGGRKLLQNILEIIEKNLFEGLPQTNETTPENTTLTAEPPAIPPETEKKEVVKSERSIRSKNKTKKR